MKNLLLLAFATTLLFSCEDIETNSPSLQASIDNVLFKATDARVTQNDDGTFLVQGITNDEALTLKISNNNVGTYVVGGGSGNYATFENSLGITYSTSPEGSGEIIVTDLNPTLNAMSGTFNFTAMVPGVDTITVQNGVFFEVLYDGNSGGGGNTNDGTLLATVDENPFNPFNVSAVDTGNSIIILGANNSSSISVIVPIDVEAGSFDLPENGFSASYTLNSVEEDAIFGNIVIISHEVGVKTLTGTFSFLTENHTIEQGQFNVTYQ